MITKSKAIVLRKIRDSARGEECTLHLAVCQGGTETTVWAHSNYTEDGKGMGRKADDIFGCYACMACHDEYDGRTHRLNLPDGEIRDRFHRAMKASWRRLIEKGVLK